MNGTEKRESCDLAVVSAHVSNLSNQLCIAASILEMIRAAKTYHDVYAAASRSQEALMAMVSVSGAMREIHSELAKGYPPSVSEAPQHADAALQATL